MAMSYVASSSAGAATGAASITITKPTGTLAGDVLVVALTANKNPWTVPSGWTQLQMGEASGTTAFRSYLYWKLAGGSEPSSYQFSGSDGASPLVGTMIAIRGCNPQNPIMDSDVEVKTTVSSGADPASTITVTRSAIPSRLLYWRTNRNTNSFSPTFSESSGGWDIGTQAVGGTGGTRYGSAVAYTGDFGTTGTSGAPAGGIVCDTSTTDNIFFMVALSGVEPTTGELEGELPSLSAEFEGERVPNSGELDAELPKLSAQASGVHLVPATGGITTSLPSIQSDMAGSTPVLAQMSATLSLFSELVGETRQFGEHIIRVEREERAFLVVDDATNTGLRPIKRSRVYQDPIPQVEAAAGVADVVAGAFEAAGTVSGEGVSASAQAVTVSVGVGDASAEVVGSTDADAGAVGVTVAASDATVSTSVSGAPGAGLAAAQAEVNDATVSISISDTGEAEAAAVSAAAYDAEVSTESAANASAGEVEVQATANNASVTAVSIKTVSAGDAAATATANSATVKIGPAAELVTAAVTG